MERTCCGGVSPKADLVAWPEEARALRKQLRALESPCGCVAAALALAGTAATWVALTLTSGSPPPPFHSASSGALALLAAAMAGKLVGILGARWRHAVLHRRLRALLHVPVPADSPVGGRA